MAGGGIVSISKTGHVLFFGFGFCAAALAPFLARGGWKMSATLRDPSRASELAQDNIIPLFLDTDWEMEAYSHVLVSAPPARDGSDPAFEALAARLDPGALDWIGYLSTTGVYGDHNGAWIDEETPPGRWRARAKRAAAEQRWSNLAMPMGFRFSISGWREYMGRCAMRWQLARGHGATHSQTRSGVFTHSCG